MNLSPITSATVPPLRNIHRGKIEHFLSTLLTMVQNQAIFDKFYISNGEGVEFKVDATFKAPFNQILEPLKDDIARINSAMRNHSDKLNHFIDIAKGHIQELFGCGLNAVNSSTLYETSSNDSNFFKANSSSNVFLVEARGIEPSVSFLKP